MKIKRKALAIAALILIWPQSLIAEPTGTTLSRQEWEYAPPKDQPRHRQQRTRAAGSRGCEGEFPALHLLVPDDHIALTISERPEFFWYVSQVPSVPMEFTLVEQGVPEITYQQRFENREGLIKLELPSSVSLNPAKIYRWTVSLICSQTHPSQNIYARAWLKRLEIPDELLRVREGENLDHQVSQYAQAGIWYDAVSVSYAGVPLAFRQLMEQIGISSQEVPIFSLYEQ